MSKKSTTVRGGNVTWSHIFLGIGIIPNILGMESGQDILRDLQAPENINQNHKWLVFFCIKPFSAPFFRWGVDQNSLRWLSTFHNFPGIYPYTPPPGENEGSQKLLPQKMLGFFKGKLGILTYFEGELFLNWTMGDVLDMIRPRVSGLSISDAKKKSPWAGGFRMEEFWIFVPSCCIFS